MNALWTRVGDGAQAFHSHPNDTLITMVVVGLRAGRGGGLSRLGAQQDGEEIVYLQGMERQGGQVRSPGTSGPPAGLQLNAKAV